MTIRDYITQKLSSFSLVLKEADFVDIGLTYSLNIQDEITADNKVTVDRAYVSFIPKILAMPNVSEGGMSITWDRAALKEHYSMMCRELGLRDDFKPTVRFR